MVSFTITTGIIRFNATCDWPTIAGVMKLCAVYLTKLAIQRAEMAQKHSKVWLHYMPETSDKSKYIKFRRFQSGRGEK